MGLTSPEVCVELEKNCFIQVSARGEIRDLKQHRCNHDDVAVIGNVSFQIVEHVFN